MIRQIGINGHGTSYPCSYRIKETLINCLCGRIAALRGARNLNIFLYMPRFLRSVRAAQYPAQTITQSFLNRKVICSLG